MGFLIRLVVNALALIAVAYLVPGVHVSGFGGALIAALILGIVNAVLRPVLVILSLPLEIVTLGPVHAGHQRAAVLAGRQVRASG